MKSFIPFLVVLFFYPSMNLNGQEVFPDQSVNQKWEYTTWNFWGGSCYKRIIKCGEVKTVCSNDNYIEIFDCNEREEECILIGFYRFQNDSILIRTNYPYLKNKRDTVDCSEPEGLMYDFSVPEDTEITCQINSTFPPTFTEFWKTDEQVINYEGIERTTLSMTYRPHPNAPSFLNKMKWIQGIGSTIHPFYSLTCIGDHCEWEQKLTKVTKEGVVIYQDSAQFSFPCRTWLGNKNLSQLRQEHYVVYPNPASSTFMIKSKSKTNNNVQLIIHDLLGRVVVPQFNYQLNEQVNIDYIVQGTYLVSLIINNKHLVIKFVKE